MKFYCRIQHFCHYSGDPDNLSGRIQYTNLDSFSGGKTLFFRVYFDRFNVAETITRAQSRLGENEYDLATNNCEHFCSWCITGNRSSSQVDALLEPTRGLFRAAGRGTVGWAFNVRNGYLDLKLKHFNRNYEFLQRFIQFRDC